MTHFVASAPVILIKRRLQYTLSYLLPTFFASFGLLRRGLRLATTWLLRSAQKRLVSYIHLCIIFTELIRSFSGDLRGYSMIRLKIY